MNPYEKERRRGFFEKLFTVGSYPKLKVNNLPDYTERSSEQVLNHPYLAKNVHLYSFFLKSDVNKLQNQLDKYLNNNWEQNSGYRFEVLSEYMILSFGSLEMFPTEPPASLKGWVKETEAIFWILALAHRWEKRKNKGYQPNKIVLFPYSTYMDHPMSIVAGREICGFPKEGANIILPEPTEKLNFQVDTYVFSEFKPETLSELKTLITAKQIDNTEKRKNGSNDEFSLLQFINSIFLKKFNSGILENLIKNLSNRSVNLIYLKQFRDIALPTKACYKSVVLQEAKVSTLKTISLLRNDFEINIHNYDSHPFMKELGMQDQYIINNGIYVNMDFLFGTGSEIWNSFW